MPRAGLVDLCLFVSGPEGPMYIREDGEDGEDGEDEMVPHPVSSSSFIFAQGSDPAACTQILISPLLEKRIAKKLPM